MDNLINKLVCTVDIDFQYYWSASEGKWLSVSDMDDKHLWKAILKHNEVRFICHMAVLRNPELQKLIMRICSNIENAIVQEWMRRQAAVKADWFSKINHRTFVFNPLLTVTGSEIEYCKRLWSNKKLDKWSGKDHDLSQRVGRHLCVKHIVNLAKTHYNNGE